PLPGSSAIVFSSPQYGQTTNPAVSAVPSPSGKSSSRSSKKSIIGVCALWRYEEGTPEHDGVFSRRLFVLHPGRHAVCPHMPTRGQRNVRWLSVTGIVIHRMGGGGA